MPTPWPDFPFASAPLPSLQPAQMAAVDRIMTEDLGISLLQMMEHAGRALALVAMARYEPASVTVLAGPGGNGGGGLVAARHLANRGIAVRVVLSRPRHDLKVVPALQAGILVRMGVPVEFTPRDADLVVDALLGYSLRGDPKAGEAALIEWANLSGRPTLALDGPSGLDFGEGRPGVPCIRADATLTLALPKTGLALAGRVVGDLYLADIGVPPAVYGALGLHPADPFQRGPVVRLT